MTKKNRTDSGMATRAHKNSKAGQGFLDQYGIINSNAAKGCGHENKKNIFQDHTQA